METRRLSVVHEIEVRRHTPAQVWAFVRPAESAVLLAKDVVRAFARAGHRAWVSGAVRLPWLLSG